MHKRAAWRTFRRAIRHFHSDPLASNEESRFAPLAFVGRCGEVFDVLHVNLRNQEALRTGSNAKMWTPLAAQPPGTGKTDLGRHIVDVLQRPQESSAAALSETTRRLLSARAWHGAPAGVQDRVAAELMETGPGGTLFGQQNLPGENATMRLLCTTFPHHTRMLHALKASTPIVVPLRALPRPGTLLGF